MSPGRVVGLAAAVNRDDLGHRFELGVGGVGPVGGDRPAGRMVGEGEDLPPRKASQSCSRALVCRVDELRTSPSIAEVQHVAVAVDPARPLVAEQRHEAVRVVDASACSRI